MRKPWLNEELIDEGQYLRDMYKNLKFQNAEDLSTRFKCSLHPSNFRHTRRRLRQRSRLILTFILAQATLAIAASYQIVENNTYSIVLTVPPSQWYLGGTVFHRFAKATIAPASSTPKPKRWLNSKPTPFIVQWNRFLASNREFLFEVRTVKCCMSLHVNLLLEKEINM